MVICTDYKSKDKFSKMMKLKKIIWSDGQTSEFKNKYMCHLMDKFSIKNNRFLWKFSATSHGKGVVDGIGGNVKSIVQSQSMGKRKDKIIVQDAKFFYHVASKAMNATDAECY